MQYARFDEVLQVSKDGGSIHIVRAQRISDFGVTRRRWCGRHVGEHGHAWARDAKAGLTYTRSKRVVLPVCHIAAEQWPDRNGRANRAEVHLCGLRGGGAHQSPAAAINGGVESRCDHGQGLEKRGSRMNVSSVKLSKKVMISAFSAAVMSKGFSRLSVLPATCARPPLA
jgi:hypothetical protein